MEAGGKKRKLEEQGDADEQATQQDRRPMCWYGFACHSKVDPLHDRRFRHPTSISGEKAWLAECADEEARLKAAYDAEEQAHPLPEGWHKIKHEPSGLDSYVHRQSGAVCWTRPYVIPPITDNEEEHLKSIATHEIPLFPFAMILQLTELVARVETNRLTSTYVAERDEVLNSRTDGRRTTKDEGDRMEEGEVATPNETVASSNPQQGAEAHTESSADSGGVAPSPVLHPHVRTHRAASAPREVVRAATPMEKAILSVLSRAVKSKKLDSVGDVPAPARPPHRERRGKTQGVKARAASFSVEAAAQKTPITQLQEYCVNVLKTSPRYVTTTQEDPTRPYVTTVEIAGREYGRGAYINKKQSKHMAAEATLRLLCPEYAAAAPSAVSVGQQKESAYADPYRLDVDDEAVLSLAHTKSPTQVLQEYGNRVHAILAFKSEQVSPAQLRTTGSSKPPGHACRVEVRLDNLSTTGVATTKREAKQRAAQLMLKQLRPEARSWGELLDLEEADTAAAQGGGAASGSARRRGGDVESDTHASDMPNLRLLEQLKDEMRKRLLAS